MNTNQRITVKTKIALEAERLKRLEAGKRPSECSLTIIMEEMAVSQPALLEGCEIADKIFSNDKYFAGGPSHSKIKQAIALAK